MKILKISFWLLTFSLSLLAACKKDTTQTTTSAVSDPLAKYFGDYTCNAHYSFTQKNLNTADTQYNVPRIIHVYKFEHYITDSAFLIISPGLMQDSTGMLLNADMTLSAISGYPNIAFGGYFYAADSIYFWQAAGSFNLTESWDVKGKKL